MNPVTKALVPVATDKINKFYLPSSHLTTGNFMQFNIAYARQLRGKSHGSLRHKTFLRSEPLYKPCLGSARITNRVFFVPYRVVWPAFTDFINDVPHNTPSGTALIPNVPEITFAVFETLFSTTSFNLSLQVTSADPYDFVSGGNYYVLTPFGRQSLKILESLGYKIIWGLSDKTKSVSALPLLCAAKVYLDYYYPSAYAHYGVYASIDGIMQRHSTYSLTAAEVLLILQVLDCVSYDNDFWTSVWDNPVGPNPNVGSTNFVIPDITISGNANEGFKSTLKNDTSNNSNATPRLVGNNTSGQPGASTSVYQLSQYALDSLRALTSYVKRHQLVGSRSLERALAAYGVALDAEKLMRCIYLGDDSFPYEIGDVMSNADTSGASLGAYAGKGLAYSAGKDFDFETDEFGYLLVINTIIPDVSYVEGIDRNVLNLTKLDFHTGEFDALGPAAVSQAEVFVGDGSSVFNTTALSRLFGYGSRYYEWKIPYDRLTGNFRYGSINATLNGWSTVRHFDEASLLGVLVHSLDFVLGKDAVQYDRIFLGTSSEDILDPFFIIHRDELILYAPMKPLYDSYDFHDEEDHQQVSFEPNGVKMN